MILIMTHPPTLLTFDEIKKFIEKGKDDEEYLFMIWIRCIEGDKNNLVHKGWQARYPRSKNLLKRIIELVNTWKVLNSTDSIPTLSDFNEFVIQEVDEKKMIDASHVDRRCVRGYPDAKGVCRYPKDKAMLKRMLDMFTAFQLHDT